MIIITEILLALAGALVLFEVVWIARGSRMSERQQKAYQHYKDFARRDFPLKNMAEIRGLSVPVILAADAREVEMLFGEWDLTYA